MPRLDVRPINLPLDLYAGDTFAHQITFETDEGVAIDKSTSTFAAQIRSPAGAASILETITVVTTGAANGEIILYLAPADVTMALDGAQWDLQETAANDVVTTILAGPVTVTQDVTR